VLKIQGVEDNPILGGGIALQQIEDMLLTVGRLFMPVRRNHFCHDEFSD
jgi:hypothetical protein